MKKSAVYRKFAALIVFIAMALAVSPLWGQGYDSVGANGYIGARVGYIELENVDDDGSLNLGLYGGAFIAPFLSVEASVDWQEGEVFIEGDDYVVSVPLLDRETIALQAGLKLMPMTEGPIRLYLNGGVGYYASHYVDRGGFYDFYSSDIDEGGFYGGGGIELFGDASDARGLTITWDTRWLFTEKEEWRQDHVRADGWVTSLGCTLRF